MAATLRLIRNSSSSTMAATSLRRSKAMAQHHDQCRSDYLLVRQHRLGQLAAWHFRDRGNQRPRVDVNGALVVLSNELRNQTEVLREACAARSGRRVLKLAAAGRGGFPLDPEATLPALYIAGRDVEPNPKGYRWYNGSERRPPDHRAPDNALRLSR
jgi:hypothetical protein